MSRELLFAWCFRFCHPQGNQPVSYWIGCVPQSHWEKSSSNVNGFSFMECPFKMQEGSLGWRHVLQTKLGYMLLKLQLRIIQTSKAQIQRATRVSDPLPIATTFKNLFFTPSQPACHVLQAPMGLFRPWLKYLHSRNCYHKPIIGFQDQILSMCFRLL